MASIQYGNLIFYATIILVHSIIAVTIIVSMATIYQLLFYVFYFISSPNSESCSFLESYYDMYLFWKHKPAPF